MRKLDSSEWTWIILVGLLPLFVILFGLLVAP